jgi:hypothetical protein
MLLSARSQSTVDATVAEPSPPSWMAAQNDFPADDHQRDLPKGPRITYSVVSIMCMLLLATMLGESTFEHGVYNCLIYLTLTRVAVTHYHRPQTQEATELHPHPGLPALLLRDSIRRNYCDPTVWPGSQHRLFVPRSYLCLPGLLPRKQSVRPALPRGKSPRRSVPSEATQGRSSVASLCDHHRLGFRKHYKPRIRLSCREPDRRSEMQDRLAKQGHPAFTGIRHPDQRGTDGSLRRAVATAPGVS